MIPCWHPASLRHVGLMVWRNDADASAPLPGLDAVPEINENGANQHGFDNIKPSRKNQGGNSAPHHR